MMFDNLLGEFIGTMVLIVFGAGVCACNTLTKSKGQNGGWICITAGWGFAVTLGVYTATTLGAPQGDLNPAVTLGKTMIGIYSVPQFFATSIAQILGGIAGGILVYILFKDQFDATEDPGTKLGVFSTGPSVPNTGRNIVQEAIATFVLVFAICGMNQVPGLDAGVGKLLVFGIIVSIGMSLGGLTGYALNPARDLGPRIAHAILPIKGKGDSNFKYGLVVPIVGPILGGIVAVLLYNAIPW